MPAHGPNARDTKSSSPPPPTPQGTCDVGDNKTACLRARHGGECPAPATTARGPQQATKRQILLACSPTCSCDDDALDSAARVGLPEPRGVRAQRLQRAAPRVRVQHHDQVGEGLHAVQRSGPRGCSALATRGHTVTAGGAHAACSVPWFWLPGCASLPRASTDRGEHLAVQDLLDERAVARDLLRLAP
jgi:hypothetical protein